MLCLLLAAALQGGVAADDGSAAPGPREPSGYLDIYKVNSAVCQALRRGKMNMLRNLHPSKTIHYRMSRSLAGKRQAGLIRGTIPPTGEEGEPLGCELLEGLRQEWNITRAEFPP